MLIVENEKLFIIENVILKINIINIIFYIDINI